MEAHVLDNLPSAELGEGPLWDVKDQQLYWVDITGCKVHRYDPATQQYDTLPTGTYVGFAVLDDSGNVIVGLRDGIYQMGFGNVSRALLARPDAVNPDNRFNDGKVSPDGRLWAGTTNLTGQGKPPTGSLYRLDRSGLTTVENHVYISNGLGWSPDKRTMYYTDSLTHQISEFDYDASTGTASNRRLFAEVPAEQGLPDGLAVDSQGRVLSAMWGGSRVNIYSPRGRLEDTIRVPVPQSSSVAFGGSNLRTLFITTARIDLTEPQLVAAPLSGRLFAVDMTVPGLPSTRFSETPQLQTQPLTVVPICGKA